MLSIKKIAGLLPPIGFTIESCHDARRFFLNHHKINLPAGNTACGSMGEKEVLAAGSTISGKFDILFRNAAIYHLAAVSFG